MLSYLLITGIMGALKSYSSIIGLFGEGMGPYGDYEMGTMVGYIYDMIGNDQIGYAAAGSIILFIIIMIFTAINTQVSKKRVHY
jgi:multiple sugar transport system permease protein